MYEVYTETLYYDGWGNFDERYFNSKDEAITYLKNNKYEPTENNKNRWVRGSNYVNIVPSDITKNAKSYIVMLNLDGFYRPQVFSDSRQGAMDYVRKHFSEYQKVTDNLYEYHWSGLNKDYTEYVYIKEIDRIN